MSCYILLQGPTMIVKRTTICPITYLSPEVQWFSLCIGSNPALDMTRLGVIAEIVHLYLCGHFYPFCLWSW